MFLSRCLTLGPHSLQHARLPCPSLPPSVCSNSCPSSQWCHPTISSSVTLFSHLQSFSAPGSFPVCWIFASGGQSIGASASLLPVNIQGWIPLVLPNLIPLQFKGLSRVSFSTTIQKHQFFGARPSLWSNSHLHSQVVKNLPTNAGEEMRVWSLGLEDLLEEGMGIHPSILAWRIPWTAWQATVHRVAKSWTRLKRLSTQLALTFVHDFLIH